ncbi:MAG TPA: hypothetical protein ENK86_01470 [Campylobacterales bacterium]|nr:hypothetical protein [Campylobacterales bacterium]
MQTIRIDIEESKVDILLNLLSHLKEDIIKSYSVSPKIDDNLSLDPYFYERQKRLKQLREEVHSGQMPMHDFNTSMDELIEELKS